MNCNEYENLITDYLENTATPPQRIQMESHLSECETCRSLAERERSVMEQLRGLSIEPCPDGIIEAVMRTIPWPGVSWSKRILSWIRFGPPMRYGIASLASAIVIVLLLFFFTISGPHRKTGDDFKYTNKEIKQATVEAKLALAYFLVYARKSETAFEKIDLVKPVIKPIEGTLNHALSKIPYI
jgi:hypothetical protein